ncbi:protein NDRG3 isoform X3 [Daktulosphaira vitifoliae]|uniref:protein NDRG3 isoform X3 n=1 Tax=Daktulosphaira vitifoliae TaxID=58002 RepID=UPI0021AA4308|nr:protein NDRG3 isoform X3 [Daktulosphaira vitifoliae]
MSYRSLAADRVYKATTDDLQPERKNSVGTVFKKAFGSLSSSPRRRLSEPLMQGVPVIGSGNVNTPLRKMPTSVISEEASLLSSMRSDTMEEVELTGVRPSLPAVRTFTRSNTGVEEVYVDTDNGPVCVAVQGDRSRPPILTYHDLGLNYITSFQTFFNYSGMRNLTSNFCIYHVNAPGQEEGAPPLPDNYVYPTMDELANQLDNVLKYFDLKSVVGLGVGTGGNILARFAFKQPLKIEALVLVNVVSTSAGWIEYGYQKLNARYLKSKGMTQGVLDYLMWYHFGKGTEMRNHDLARVYREYFVHSVHPGNLAAFIDSYVRRTDLGISRSTPTSESSSAGRRPSMTTTLQMPIINVCGALSPHQEDTVTLNSKLDPTKSSWMKISECSMVLEEVPHKMCEVLRLFLQGLGYAVRLGRPPLTVSRSAEGKNDDVLANTFSARMHD